MQAKIKAERDSLLQQNQTYQSQLKAKDAEIATVASERDSLRTQMATAPQPGTGTEGAGIPGMGADEGTGTVKTGAVKTGSGKGVAVKTGSSRTSKAASYDLSADVMFDSGKSTLKPGAKTALEYTYSGRIGVIGTQGTIRSSSYTTSIKKLDPNARVFAQACPLFVPLVEEGWIDHRVTAEVAKEYLKPLIRNKVDTIVLGCTHYPLIKKVLKKLTGPGIKLVDSAEATAREVLFTLNRLGMLNAPKRKASYQFYVSDIPQKFQEIGQRCLGRPVAPVRRIDLEKKK
jgi:hypothetical protein